MVFATQRKLEPVRRFAGDRLGALEIAIDLRGDQNVADADFVANSAGDTEDCHGPGVPLREETLGETRRFPLPHAADAGGYTSVFRGVRAGAREMIIWVAGVGIVFAANRRRLPPATHGIPL